LSAFLSSLFFKKKSKISLPKVKIFFRVGKKQKYNHKKIQLQNFTTPKLWVGFH